MIKGARFTGKLQVEYINGRQWRVLNDLRSFKCPVCKARIGENVRQFSFITDLGDQIIVPHGFVTDFASIPRALWRVLPPIGDGARARYGVGAVIHDLLYKTGKINNDKITRVQADYVLKRAMQALGVSKWRVLTIMAGLKVGGWVTWNRYRKQDDAD